MDEDLRLLVSIETSMAEAVRRGGVVCHLGCTDCCRGAFEVTALDALRLRGGLRRLLEDDPAKAARVQARVAADVGDDDGLCPALDPLTGACDLYDARPVTCRTFGPATRTVEGGVAACELCYTDCSDDEVAVRAVDVDPEGREAALIAALEASGHAAVPSVAAALRVTASR